MKEILQGLREYFRTDVTWDVSWREGQLRALMRMLEEQRGTLTDALHADLGKSAEEAWLTEIGFVEHEARHVLKHLRGWCKPQRVSTPMFLQPASSFVRAQPRGLALIIAPWNYPAQLAVSPLIAAIAAGDVCVIKPSEISSATAAWFAKYIPEYLDPKAFAVIEADVKGTTELLREPFDFIFFTGSTATAKHIARAAAEHLTPTVLELGGKSPCIVTNCHKLAIAANRIVFAKFINAGQTCVAPDYVIVQESQREALETELKRALYEQFGCENAPSGMGHIINERHFDRLDAMFDNGEIILYGGARSRETLTIAPTLMEVELSHPCMQEEIFGPILPIISVAGSDIMPITRRIVDLHPTPLACYLFSDSERDEAECRKIISGGYCHNDALMHLSNVHLPFGGVGTSGHGSSHGIAGFRAFSHLRAELDQSASIDIPLRYPPFTERSMTWLRRFMR